jgi:hypothetical protein
MKWNDKEKNIETITKVFSITTNDKPMLYQQTKMILKSKNLRHPCNT